MATLQPNKDQEVTINQQGLLSVHSVTSAEVTATGTYTNTATVPVGKKWIIKGYTTSAISGSFTMNVSNMGVEVVGASQIGIATGFTFQNLVPFSLTLSEGDKLVNGIIVNGFTSNGYIRTDILYVELDA